MQYCTSGPLFSIKGNQVSLLGSSKGVLEVSATCKKQGKNKSYGSPWKLMVGLLKVIHPSTIFLYLLYRWLKAFLISRLFT